MYQVPASPLVFRGALLCASGLLSLSAVSAQTTPAGFVKVHGAALVDAQGEPADATVCAQAIIKGVPVSVRIDATPLGAITTTRQVCTSAAMASWTLTLPDTSTSASKNVTFKFTAKDNVTGEDLLFGYDQVQPTGETNSWCTGGVCELGKLSPNTPALAVIQAGPTGPRGATGDPGCLIGNTGSCTQTIGFSKVNATYFAGSSSYPSVQAAVNAACSGGGTAIAQVTARPGMGATDPVSSIAGGCSGVTIVDERDLPFTTYRWNGTAYLQKGSRVQMAGAVGDGIADDTAALTSAIAQATSGGTGTVVLPAGHYHVTSQIEVPRGVNLIGQDNGLSDDGGHTFIEGNLTGPILHFSNGAGGSLIQGFTVSNSHASCNGASSAVRFDGDSGPGIFRDMRLQSNDTALMTGSGNGNEIDSYSLENVYLAGDGNYLGCTRGLAAFGRNVHVRGGRSYASQIAYYFSGDDWVFDGVNVEFVQVPFLFGPTSGFEIRNSHVENAGMIATNANTLPDFSTFPWTDKGGTGNGWTGTGRFIGNNFLLNSHGTGSVGQGGPAFVIKSQPSMIGRLTFDGNNLSFPGTNGSVNFNTVSGSFDYTAAASLVNGVRVLSSDAINIPAIPYDNYTSWTDLSAGHIGLHGNVSLDAPAITINGVASPRMFTGTTAQFPSSAQSVAAGSCVIGTATISGINRYWTATASGVYYDAGDGFDVRAFVAGDGPTVNVKVCARVAATLNPQQYNVIVTENLNH